MERVYLYVLIKGSRTRSELGIPCNTIVEAMEKGGLMWANDEITGYVVCVSDGIGEYEAYTFNPQQNVEIVPE